MARTQKKVSQIETLKHYRSRYRPPHCDFSVRQSRDIEENKFPFVPCTFPKEAWVARLHSRQHSARAVWTKIKMAEESDTDKHKEVARIFNNLPERQAKVNILLASQEKVGTKEDDVYCICRTSDINRFMICCDNCDEWFHGDCIGITKPEAKDIKQFYCKPCLGSNPGLRIKYRVKVKKFKPEQQPREDDPDKKRSRRMCGECVACLNTVDCGSCDFCKDMRKFGGPNKMRQKCRLRQCLFKSRILLRRTTKYADTLRAEQAKIDPSSECFLDHRPRKRKHLLDAKQHKAVKMKHARSSTRKGDKGRRQPGWRRKRITSSDERRASLDLINEREKEEVLRQCYGPGCGHAARTNSKYCSDECGIQLAVRRIQEILPERVKQWKERPCIADQKAAETLEEVEKRKKEAQDKLLELDRLSQGLDAIVEKAKTATIDEQEMPEQDYDGETDLQVHCVTCGLPLAPRVALRHMEKCYMKNESLTTFGSVFKSAGSLFCDSYNQQQKTYCKRLRVLCPEHTKDPKISPEDVCGCPLVNNVFQQTDKICRAPKRSCMRHYCWEKLRRAEIDLQRVQQWLKLEESYEQERTIRYNLTQRGGVLALLLHQTNAQENNPQ